MTAPDMLLPVGARLVHIGPHKTGSTAIQQALHRSRARLREHGVDYPGRGTRERRAGWALGLPGKFAHVERPPLEEWERFVAEVAASDAARVCVSNEDFGRADEAMAARIVADLGGDDVHVVAVARRLDRYLPSQWQERIKASAGHSLEEWLEVVLHGDRSSWDYRNVWQAHDLQALVRRWTDVVGADRFTLLIGSDQEPHRMPRLFEELLGLPTGFLELVPDLSNRSLDHEQVELLRAVNLAFKERGWLDERHRRVVKHGLLPELAASSGTGRRTLLPAWALEEVRELSRRRVDQVREMKVRVIGDPAELLVPDGVQAAPVDDPTPPPVPVGLAGAAVAAAVGSALARPAARPVAGAGAPRRAADLSGRELLRLAARRAARRLRR